MCAEAATAVERSDNTLPLVWIAASLGVLELSLGDPAAAWEACEPLVVALEVQGIAEPRRVLLPPRHARVPHRAWRAGPRRAAPRPSKARGRELDPAWALPTGACCRGLLLAARGDLDAASVALELALGEHGRVDMPFELARTLIVRGVIERRTRKRAPAKAAFEQALAIFEDVRADLWAAQARAELDRVGLRRGQRPGNRAARRRARRPRPDHPRAGRRAVPQPQDRQRQLTRVYRKLGINSRAQPGAHMAHGEKPRDE